ncbi:Mannan endo-1,4-beta-mannosidase [Gryganskiella cystojenkinii]|nr:Mannan endo-1,4-beta-mannosidase [Gryganskiella cystojenkinii]
MVNKDNMHPGAVTIDLTGEWALRDSSNTVNVKAIVPGQVHLDLIQASLLENNLYFGKNYVKESVQEIMKKTWVFEKNFQIHEKGPYSNTFLDCEGLDSVATVFLNEKLIGTTDNQFRHYFLDVSDALKQGSNTLTIQFDSALEHVERLGDTYPYYVIYTSLTLVLVSKRLRSSYREWRATTALLFDFNEDDNDLCDL